VCSINDMLKLGRYLSTQAWEDDTRKLALPCNRNVNNSLFTVSQDKYQLTQRNPRDADAVWNLDEPPHQL